MDNVESALMDKRWFTAQARPNSKAMFVHVRETLRSLRRRLQATNDTILKTKDWIDSIVHRRNQMNLRSKITSPTDITWPMMLRCMPKDCVVNMLAKAPDRAKYRCARTSVMHESNVVDLSCIPCTALSVDNLIREGKPITRSQRRLRLPERTVQTAKILNKGTMTRDITK